MTTLRSFADYEARLRQFIEASLPASLTPGAEAWIPRAPAAPTDTLFNELALALFALQAAHVPIYQQLCRRQRTTANRIAHWSEIPPMPTAGFRDFDVTSLAPTEQTRVFHSSGTTGARPSRHYHDHRSLALYEASASAWFGHNVLRGSDRIDLLILAPPAPQVPHSSLAHMFDTVCRSFGGPNSAWVGEPAAGLWALNPQRALAALRQAATTGRPLAILGTAFSFVHLLEALGRTKEKFPLPAGSLVMETGGYKGRSRAFPRSTLHSMICRHFSLPSSAITCEYGMSELSSQAYTRTPTLPASPPTPAGHPHPHPSPPGAPEPVAEPKPFHFPPWARARVISTETGREVGEGQTGLLRVYDLANLRSVLAVQTEDLAVRRGTGFDLLGRAPQAELRGCSLLSLEPPHPTTPRTAPRAKPRPPDPTDTCNPQIRPAKDWPRRNRVR